MKVVFVIASIISITACDLTESPTQNHLQRSAPPFTEAENYPGGQATVAFQAQPSLQLPAANLADELKANFHAGKALANQPWVKAPTVTFARDGLGPVYNARTCLMCHVKGGKGFVPENNKTPIRGTLVRLSKKIDPQNLTIYSELIKQKGVIPHPMYGDQIQGQSVSLAHQLRHSQKPGTIKHDVPPEAYVHINWVEKTFIYPDQHHVSLRKPELDFKYLGYGPLEDDTEFSLRVAPTIQGMGLLSLIAEQDLMDLADENDNNKDGISGRVNQVWDIKKQTTAVGRFGLKSNKPSLAIVVGGAFTHDMGITNALAPNQPCTDLQTACLKIPHGNDEQGVELPDHLLELVINFNRDLAPVKRRNSQDPSVMAGRESFYQAGCNQCHTPRFVTQKSDTAPHLSEQVIWPYSDLLLHDMGPELADGRPDYLATGSEWRTAPLWGVGLLHRVNGSKVFLHDGRAQSIEEAILWHGGEASQAKNYFVQLKKSDRDDLINFVNSL